MKNSPLSAHAGHVSAAKEYSSGRCISTNEQNASDLCSAVNQLEQGAGSIAVSSGLSASTLSLLAFTGAGDHVLMPDTVSTPQRRFCDTILRRYGVETTFCDPRIGSEIDVLIKANTRVIYTESPGSLTFEMQDMPAIAEAAHRHSVVVITDNTWAGPHYFKPLTLGADICVEDTGQYMAKHSASAIGIITARTSELYKRIHRFCLHMGETAYSDACAKGFSRLPMLAQMDERFHHALNIARWLKQQPEVTDVLYPPLENDEGHFLWKRDFTGGGACFSIVLPKIEKKVISSMLDGYRLFRPPLCHDGFCSIAELCCPERTTLNRIGKVRTEANSTLIRYFIGLEDTEELIQDLNDGFIRLRKALA